MSIAQNIVTVFGVAFIIFGSSSCQSSTIYYGPGGYVSTTKAYEGPTPPLPPPVISSRHQTSQSHRQSTLPAGQGRHAALPAPSSSQTRRTPTPPATLTERVASAKQRAAAQTAQFRSVDPTSSPESVVWAWSRAVRSNDCDAQLRLSCDAGQAALLGARLLTGACGSNPGFMETLSMLNNIASDYSAVYYERGEETSNRAIVHHRGYMGVRDGWTNSRINYKRHNLRSTVILDGDEWKICS